MAQQQQELVQLTSEDRTKLGVAVLDRKDKLERIKWESYLLRSEAVEIQKDIDYYGELMERVRQLPVVDEDD